MYVSVDTQYYVKHYKLIPNDYIKKNNVMIARWK